MARAARQLELAGVFASAITPRRADSQDPDFSGLLELLDFLTAGGVKGICLFGATGEFLNYSFAERQTGFEDACTVHKVSGTVWAVPVGGRTLIEDEILRGLQAVDRPSAVLAADDHHALAVLRVAHALGLRVPEDLSVAGFDDLCGSELAGPGLTTLRVDWEGMGLRAVRGIFRMMELSPELSGFEEVPVELVVRGSTGPAGR